MEVDLNLFASIGEKMDHMNAAMDRLKQPMPLRYPVAGYVQGAAAPLNPTLVAVPPASGPTKDRVWEIVKVGIFGNDGHTAVNTPIAVTAITLPANNVAGQNTNPVPVDVTVAGGTVTAITVNGVNQGAVSGVFLVPAGGNIVLTYSVAPTTFTTAYAPGQSQSTPALADIYAGPVAGLDAPGDFQSLFANAQPIPTIMLPGRHKVIAKPDDTLYAYVYNPPANVQLVLVAYVMDWKLSDYESMKIGYNR